ncbi:long-chain-fatty-acid-CoA-ligase [Dacryopinax primogenitus]|uniref:Long-chain-fatty-acid-CoA-ligase n=1 Tax=Dacryopinax primogenitus (strain DJM 731) TaxID=1858805 RepID=M5FXS5_DACPD|nr:long-chain-fatty-acid-CoA-ligase [Dacryopinax primogenitus]EJU00585.1 long-chain-fatty-acid-CoA-ligase [Dacryopinax primogenitus]
MAPQMGSFECGTTSPGETAPRVGYATPKGLVSRPGPDIDTVYDILQYTAKRHGDRDAIGYREILNIIEEEKEVRKMVDGKEHIEKKKWLYWQMSEFKYWTYVEFRDKVLRVASGLREMGMEPGNVFNIYADTSHIWQLMSHACAANAMIVATAYATLGESGLQHSLEEPEVAGVFTNADLLGTLLKVVDKTPTVKIIVYDGKPKADILEKLKKIRNGEIRLIHIDDLEKLGAEHPHEPTPPKFEGTACIMYTSGTTGPPKGVVITHSNLVATVGSIFTLLGKWIQQTDCFLAFLPLAHILEYVVELGMFYVGMPIGYGRVKTLTDASVRNCLGDLRAFRPTIMVGVPAVWETIRKGIVGKVNQGGTMKKNIFHGALSVKKFATNNKLPIVANLTDTVVFNQVREQTGGRLRLTLSGGAALSKETQEFLTMALVTILSGYGLTESCGMSCILPPDFMQYGPVGVPVPSMEVKLVDVEDAGYRATNNPPQGEIWIRGNSLCKGYFKRPDLNEEAFTPDGWFKTGDVGQWEKDGTMSIIDRKKNLVKLSGGEYIALERLESIYKSCNLVNNICVYADPDASKPMAVIHPHESNLRHATGSEAHLSEMCADKKVAELILKECNAVGKKAGLKGMETLQAVVLTSDEWTPENGLVTAAQKLQRRKISDRYMDEIKEVYIIDRD